METEPETPWKPKIKSQVAILECLEAIRVALIFIEYAPENRIDDYFAWWHRLARSRPNKIDQLKIHWQNTSWRIALALRKKTPFKEVAGAIMADNQLLQEAMNTEVPPERPSKPTRTIDTPWTEQTRGGKGRGKNRQWGTPQRWERRWQGPLPAALRSLVAAFRGRGDNMKTIAAIGDSKSGIVSAMAPTASKEAMAATPPRAARSLWGGPDHVNRDRGQRTSRDEGRRCPALGHQQLPVTLRSNEETKKRQQSRAGTPA